MARVGPHGSVVWVGESEPPTSSLGRSPNMLTLIEITTVAGRQRNLMVAVAIPVENKVTIQ